MGFHHFFPRPRSQAQLGNERGGRRAKPKRPAAHRLYLEPLEDRSLLSFLAPVNYATGLAPDAVAVGDFNGDGKADLVVANAGSNTVSVFLGNGDGTFQAARNYAVGGSPVSVAVGDFNHDGKLDIVTANNYPVGFTSYGGSLYSGDISVLLGNGDGTFQPARTSTIQNIGTVGSVAVGDFNRDGKLDIAVTSDAYFPPPYYCTTPQPCVGRNFDFVNVLLGNGDGSFSTPIKSYFGGLYPGYAWVTAASAAVGDFNGDGKLDVVTSSGMLLLGNGNGTFQAPVALGAAGNPLAADLNGDGKLDLVMANPWSNYVSVLLGNGNGTFQAAHNFATGSFPVAVAVGDFNGDGKLDLVTANSFSNNFSVLLGNGNGTFQTALNYAAGSGPSSVAVGDFNGGHFPDLAVANHGSNNVSVLINAADWSTVGAATHFAVSGFPSPVTAGVTSNFVVTVKDASGNTVTGYTGSVRFSSSDPQAVLPLEYTFTAADKGVHTFSATLKTAGTQSITAVDTTTSNLTGSETGITVKPAAAKKFVLSAPSQVTAGVPFQVTVTVEDAFGNVVTGYGGTVHFKSTDKKATLPHNYTLTAADQGVHTFKGIVLRTKGKQTITITDALNSSIIGSVIVDVI